MTPNEYQQLAARTESPKEVQLTPLSAMEICDILKEIVRLGERLDGYKKEIFYKNAGEHENPMSATEKRLLHATMGIITEAGELSEQTLQMIAGEPVDMVNVGEELGDLLWYVALGCTAGHVNLEGVMTHNIMKLRKRFPNQFTSQAALHRDLEAERGTLEGFYEGPLGKPYNADDGQQPPGVDEQMQVPDRAGMWFRYDANSGHSMTKVRVWVDPVALKTWMPMPLVHWEWDQLTNAILRKAEDDLGGLAKPSRYGPGKKHDDNP